jgi:hydrogenase-4 component B
MRIVMLLQPYILSQASFVLMVAVYAAGGAGALCFRKNERLANLWGSLFAVAGSLLGLLFSAVVLVTGATPVFSFPTSFPLLSIAFHIDDLSAFFMLVISVIALFCSIYAPGYLRYYYGKCNIGLLGFCYNLFIASMILVVTASNALFFLIAWEVMSLSSYCLVIIEADEERNIRAGSLYFIMTHVGSAFILAAFLLFFQAAGSFEFDLMAKGISTASPTVKNAIFLFSLIGFGSKAGIIPLHIWLPGAHPAAPSHVSALMSGIMIKTGIYMLARICWDILPGPPALWWGLLITLIGATSSLLGVLYALSEHDLKRLLAYHSIENIGIILLGLGSSLVFLAAGEKAMAAFGLIASLYHTMNHATFKALLFLGAGSVIAETHTRNIEEYGGLIKRMPQTAFFFLVGSLAISAMPPFNGFFSEWMTFQSLFQGVNRLGLPTKMVFIPAIGALAFTGGLAAACFVKAFGVTFLARPRNEKAAQAHEAALSQRIAMAGLAVLALALGLGAGPIFSGFTHLAGSLSAFRMIEPLSPDHASFGVFGVKAGFASLSAPALFAGIGLVTGAVAILFSYGARKRNAALGATWDCGADLTARMEITATAFSRSIVTIFRGVLRPTGQIELEYNDAMLRYFPKTGRVKMEFHDIYETFIYRPLQRVTLWIAGKTKRIQAGNINVYVLYIFMMLTALLSILVI